MITLSTQEFKSKIKKENIGERLKGIGIKPA